MTVASPAPLQPTKEQWKTIETVLNTWGESAFFRCDGYLVSAEFQRISKSRLGLRVFVNGFIKGAWAGVGWVDGDPSTLSPEAAKFWCPKSKSLHSRKAIAHYEKHVGKRKAKQLGLYKKFHWAIPEWTSARSFIRHLKTHNTRIEVIDWQTYTKAIAEQRNEHAD